MAVPPYITVTYDPPLPSDTGAGFSAKAFDTVAKFNPWSTAANGLADYVNDRADEALATALGGDLPLLTGQALNLLRVNASETAAEFVDPAPALTSSEVQNPASTVVGLVSGYRLAQSVVANLNATGAAPIYACRAWVNFNGTGTVAIRASGNVSSITDNGTGDYTVNFTIAMPDANYSIGSTVAFSTTSTSLVAALRVVQPSDKLTTSCRFYASYANQSVSGSVDSPEVSVAIFR